MHFQQVVPEALLAPSNLGVAQPTTVQSGSLASPIVALFIILLSLPACQSIAESSGMRPVMATCTTVVVLLATLLLLAFTQ
ncbi:hypothetical protein F4861DRAFT_421814 [Xylaria intraflava]|nr:hypothetical protein F4861DRAFT_421814 [Xylaria intraflava]